MELNAKVLFYCEPSLRDFLKSAECSLKAIRECVFLSSSRLILLTLCVAELFTLAKLLAKDAHSEYITHRHSYSYIRRRCYYRRLFASKGAIHCLTSGLVASLAKRFITSVSFTVSYHARELSITFA
jgi:hypothetical protein